MMGSDQDMATNGGSVDDITRKDARSTNVYDAQNLIAHLQGTFALRSGKAMAGVGEGAGRKEAISLMTRPISSSFSSRMAESFQVPLLVPSQRSGGCRERI